MCAAHTRTLRRQQTTGAGGGGPGLVSRSSVNASGNVACGCGGESSELRVSQNANGVHSTNLEAPTVNARVYQKNCRGTRES
jgi:hypothetical protein